MGRIEINYLELEECIEGFKELRSQWNTEQADSLRSKLGESGNQGPLITQIENAYSEFEKSGDALYQLVNLTISFLETARDTMFWADQLREGEE